MKKTILFIVVATLCFFLKATAQNPSKLAGKVMDELGAPLAGATVRVIENNMATITAKDGTFTLHRTVSKGILLVSFVGYQSAQIPFDDKTRLLTVQLKGNDNPLNEVQVIGYGATTKRLNTGSVSTISAKDIEEQPVTNVLDALEGRISGMFIQQTNGLPGGGVSVQVRGKGSIAAGTDPLYIIDGVPYPSSVIASNSNLAASSINGAVSPLNSINPSDIESISILKDANATAIYGSRAANGVVLITTKKGKAGKTAISFNISSGINQVANLPQLLSPSQYLQIRKEAYKNDGITPSADPNSDNYAPDITIWDTTRSTDWRKYLLGRTGHVTDAQGTISGGNQTTSFIIGGNFHTETTVLPGDNLYQRGGIHMSLQHNSEDKKFYVQFSTSYTADHNELSNITSNFTGDLLLPPNFPLYDASGNLNYYLGWNPLADLNALSKTTTSNLIINSALDYNLVTGLDVKLSAGFNKINIDETQTYPTNSQYQGSTNFSNFGTNNNQNVIVEPQIEYSKSISKSKIDILLGATYQTSAQSNVFTQASNFSSDLLLDNLGSATTYSESNAVIDYKYVSLFGRANYNFNDRYLLDATIRRDGSSRFGPGFEYGTFGSVGGAWLFSNENWFKNDFSFVSHGKLRISYGLTGNDQITDYQYLSTYSSSGYNYQGVAGIQPSRIANDDFHWETTKKLNLAIELGFLNDRIFVEIERFRDLTNDQLVSYSLPYLTGFSSYQANLPATVENSGWEVELNTKNITGHTFKWSTTFNLTIPQNKLLSFNNLSTSSYANTLVIGQPITRIYGYEFAGLNESGMPQFQTKAGGITTSPSSATDQFFTLGQGYPNFYGGIGNTFSYKNLSLNIFGQFVKQYGMGGLLYTPGLVTNNYAIIANRWQYSGKATNIPLSSNSYAYYSQYSKSSANVFNTSYLRIKNISLSYDLPVRWLTKFSVQKLRIYMEAQNLFTFWNKNIPLYDPESGAGTNVPPMKTIVAGFQLTL